LAHIDKEQEMKSTKDMRNFLLTQMKSVAEGDVEISVAKGVCNLAQQVYNTMNIEIKHALAKQKLEGGEISKVDF
jgi:hypothetical protein